MAEFVSQRPFLVPAYYRWLLASQARPHIIAKTDYPGVQVPAGFDEDGKIVLNIHPEAAKDIEIEDQWIVFEAVFSVDPVVVRVPMGAVMVIFCPETDWFVDFSGDAEPISQEGRRSDKKRFYVLPKEAEGDKN